MDDPSDIDRQREEGIKRALQVTALLQVTTKMTDDIETKMADLEEATENLGDHQMTQAYQSVQKTMAQLRVLLSKAANDADVEEFDKIRGAIDILMTAIATATEQAREEALDKHDSDSDSDEIPAAAALLKTKDVTDEVAGLTRTLHAFTLVKLVEDEIVLVVGGVPMVYDRSCPDAPWRPFAEGRCLCAHVLSGGRRQLVSEYRHVSPCGRYRVTLDHELCRVDSQGASHVLPGNLKGTCLIRMEETLIAVGNDGALHCLDLAGNGKWKLVYDRLRLVSVAYVNDSLVVVTAHGQVLETRIDGDLSCLNAYTEWVVTADTETVSPSAIGSRAPEGMTFTHPDGRSMKIDDLGRVSLTEGNDLIVRVSRPDGVKEGYVCLEVRCGKGAGRDTLMHFNYCLHARQFKPNDVTYAWKLVKGPGSGYFVYNDFTADAWLGLDPLTEAIVIVNAGSPYRVEWTLTPGPDESDVNELNSVGEAANRTSETEP